MQQDKTVTIFLPSGEVQEYSVGVDDVTAIYYSKENEHYVRIAKNNRYLIYKGLPYVVDVPMGRHNYAEDR